MLHCRCRYHPLALAEEVYARCLVEEVLEVDAGPRGRNNLQRMTCYRGVTPSHVRRTNKPTVETSGEPTAAAVWFGVAAAVTDNMAAVAAAAADKAQRSDRMLTTKQGTQELAVADLGTRTHHWSHGDHQTRQIVVAVGDMDVRTRSLTLVVGEEQQDGENRRSGDACDSLGLGDEEAVVDLGHRTHVLGMVVWVRPLGSLAAVEVGNWDRVLGEALDLEVAHAHRR